MESKRENRLRKYLPVLIGWVSFIAIFEFLSSIIIDDELLLPSLTQSLAQIFSLMTNKTFWESMTATLGDTLLSTMVAIALGVPVGLLIGRSKLVRRMFESPMDWMRSIPATALFPAFLLFFGIGAKTRIAIAIYAAIFAVIIPTIYGASSVDEDRILHVKRLGFNRVQIVIHVLLWEAMPFILTGIRLAISSALVLIVVGEMFIGANLGLGYLIVFFQQRYETSSMYACIIIVGILGYSLNRFVRFFEARISYQSLTTI